MDRVDLVVLALTWVLAPPLMLCGQRVWNWLLCAPGANSAATCRMYMASSPPLVDNELAMLYMVMFMVLVMVLCLMLVCELVATAVRNYYGVKISRATTHVLRTLEELHLDGNGDGGCGKID